MNEKIKNSPYPKQLSVFRSFLHYKCCTLIEVLKFLNEFSFSDFTLFEAIYPKKSEKIVMSFCVPEFLPALLLF